jgi:hypothetical protein
MFFSPGQLTSHDIIYHRTNTKYASFPLHTNTNHTACSFACTWHRTTYVPVHTRSCMLLPLHDQLSLTGSWLVPGTHTCRASRARGVCSSCVILSRLPWYSGALQQQSDLVIISCYLRTCIASRECSQKVRRKKINLGRQRPTLSHRRGMRGVVVSTIT